MIAAASLLLSLAASTFAVNTLAIKEIAEPARQSSGFSLLRPESMACFAIAVAAIGKRKRAA